MKKKDGKKTDASKEKSRKLKLNKQSLKDLDPTEQVKGGMAVTGGMAACETYRCTQTCGCY